MPNYKGHLVGGLVTALITLYLLQWLNPSIAMATQWVACTLLGSLFPDIDTKSKGQLLLYRCLAVLLVFLILQQQFATALSISMLALLPLIVHHRGLFHRAWFIIALCAAISIYTKTVHGLFFCLGALSHIYLDVGFWRMWRIR